MGSFLFYAYDILRVGRRLHKRGGVVCFLQNLLFAISFGVVYSIMLQNWGYGKAPYQIGLGALLGMVWYHHFLSEPLLRAMVFCASQVREYVSRQKSRLAKNISKQKCRLTKNVRKQKSRLTKNVRKQKCRLTKNVRKQKSRLTKNVSK